MRFHRVLVPLSILPLALAAGGCVTVNAAAPVQPAASEADVVSVVPADAPDVGRSVDPSAPGLRLGARVSIQSFDRPGEFLRHRSFLGESTAVSSALDRADATFTLVAGLANDRCFSFESVNYPGHFLRHQGFRIKLHPRTDEELYRNDATFCVKPSIQPGTGSPWISLEAYNYPGFYVRSDGGRYVIAKEGGAFRADATLRFVRFR